MIRLKLLDIIALTIDYVSNVWVLTYRNVIVSMLEDKVPFVRLAVLETIKQNRKFICKGLT